MLWRWAMVRCGRPERCGWGITKPLLMGCLVGDLKQRDGWRGRMWAQQPCGGCCAKAPLRILRGSICWVEYLSDPPGPRLDWPKLAARAPRHHYQFLHLPTNRLYRALPTYLACLPALIDEIEATVAAPTAISTRRWSCLHVTIIECTT